MSIDLAHDSVVTDFAIIFPILLDFFAFVSVQIDRVIVDPVSQQLLPQ